MRKVCVCVCLFASCMSTADIHKLYCMTSPMTTMTYTVLCTYRMCSCHIRPTHCCVIDNLMIVLMSYLVLCFRHYCAWEHLYLCTVAMSTVACPNDPSDILTFYRKHKNVIFNYVVVVTTTITTVIIPPAFWILFRYEVQWHDCMYDAKFCANRPRPTWNRNQVMGDKLTLHRCFHSSRATFVR